MRTQLSFLGILVSLTSIFAQKDVDTVKVEHLKEVVVTAQYAPKSEKNAVYKVNSISLKTIQNKAANNLRELLQQETKINLSPKSVFGTSIEIQGISKENIKILKDGVPVMGRLNGIIDLSQINLSNIERVEIIEGPVSVFYGTDASGGIINLISKKTQEKIVEGDVSTYYEDINALNMNGNFGFKFGENQIQLNGGFYNFNGLSTNDNAIRNLNWEEKDQYFGGLSYRRSFGDLGLVYSGDFSKEKLFSVGDPDRRGNIQDKDYHTRRIDNNLNLTGQVFDNKFITATVSYLDYQRFHDTFDVDPTTFETKLSEKDTKDDNVVKFNYSGLKAQIGKSVQSDDFNYAIGTDINNELTKGSRILDNEQSIFTAALYGSANYKITKSIELQPAARYTWNSNYGSLLSPAVNALLKLGNNQKIRFSYGRGFRAPSLKEIYLDFHISAGPVTYIIKGNENLEVEKSHSLNLNYNFRKPLGNYKYFSIEPSLFYNSISNLIALSEFVNNERQYINIDKFKSVGGNLNFSYKPIKSLLLKTDVSYIGRYNKYNENFVSNEYLYSPEITTNINYEVEKVSLAFDVFYKFSGEREGFIIDPNDANNLLKTTRNSFSNLNTTVSKSFFDKVLRASVGVKNLFDVEDIETINEVGAAHSRNMQLWGRSFFIKTSYFF